MNNTYPVFKDIDITDRSLVEKFNQKFLPYCDFNFSNLLNWSSPEYPTKLSVLNDNLVIKMKDFTTDEILVSFIGDTKVAETITTLLDTYPKLSLVPEECIIGFDSAGSVHAIQEDIGNHDYILSTELVTSLSGSAFKSTRRKIHKLVTEHPNIIIKTLDLNEETTHEKIKSVFIKWAHYKNSENKAELHALETLLRHHMHYELIIVGAFDADSLIGFTTNEIVKDFYAIGSFGKVDPSYDGLSTYLEYSTCGILHEKGILYLNMEQDLGKEGLRLYKESYNPVRMLKRYTISKK